MTKSSLTLAIMAALTLSGCVAKTAFDIATAPVRAGAKVADWATTSQDEADRARGREIRRREERLGELTEDLDKLEDDCLAGNDRACRDAVATRQEIEALLPSVPVEPEP
ncbi:hypothetical protein GRF63_00260 [Erythrobacter sp. GH3-10]|uniref:Uncharacterized protein n=2 Tax=Aurantiacibacter rhizosphaerae TaxID=2691582 RepID=A0A844X9G6_9SPHN|nr:hypothetical protein [Aurantiacibacter rhizosphaerae]MWV26324.1 hypothetical protein [Aurantiacibacter rhizosphaerae]